jgi:hypothetical protein
MNENPLNDALWSAAKQALGAQPSTSALAQSALKSAQPRIDPYATLRPVQTPVSGAIQSAARAQTTGLQRTIRQATTPALARTKPWDSVLGSNKLMDVLVGSNRLMDAVVGSKYHILFECTSVIRGTESVGLGIRAVDLGFKALVAQSFAERHSAGYLVLDSHPLRLLAQSIPRTPSLIKTMDTTALFRVGLPDSQTVYDRLIRSRHR